ncbi:MAG: FecR domain-containing protein [Prevotellaceae bacterium]|jgi:ferric-dicitrate binding protein FerR (iron transport regulator)|nr:FecR domain-containing protein [Prevotellaceae bacterium]
MKKYINKIIALYVESGVEAPLRDNFHQWLADERFPVEKEDALLHLWNSTGSVPAGDTWASLESLKLKLQFAKEKKTVRFTAWKYAAAIAFIIALSGTYVFTHRAPQEVTFTEYFTDYGTSGAITLPDGSVVQANAGTLFVYPDNFGQETRTLYLSGEANFKVAKNTAAPFIVRSKHMAVAALGTEFNVTGYPDDYEVKATLVSGSICVTVADNQTDFILHAGEQFAYNTQQKNYSVRRVNLRDETAWQRGELVFRGATLGEVLAALERKFAVSFQYNTAVLGNDKFNFHFQEETTMEEIMEIIATVAGAFDYTVTPHKGVQNL